MLPESMNSSVISIQWHTQTCAAVPTPISTIAAVSGWSYYITMATSRKVLNCFLWFFTACEENTLLQQEAHSQIRNIILGIFFISLLFVGIGQTAVSTLGIPYIDDNVASKESAVYIGNKNDAFDNYLNCLHVMQACKQ